MAMSRASEGAGGDESAVISRLRAIIIPGTPDEQRLRRLLVLDQIRRGYEPHVGGEPQWLTDLSGRVERGEPLHRPQSRANV